MIWVYNLSMLRCVIFFIFFLFVFIWFVPQLGQSGFFYVVTNFFSSDVVCFSVVIIWSFFFNRINSVLFFFNCVNSVFYVVLFFFHLYINLFFYCINFHETKLLSQYFFKSQLYSWWRGDILFTLYSNYLKFVHETKLLSQQFLFPV